MTSPIAFATLLFGILAIALVSPKQGRPVAVVGPSARIEQTLGIVAEAGGRLLSLGPYASTVIAVSQDPDFAARLYAAGASLVIDASSANLCSPRTRKASI